MHLPAVIRDVRLVDIRQCSHCGEDQHRDLVYHQDAIFLAWWALQCRACGGQMRLPLGVYDEGQQILHLVDPDALEDHSVDREHCWCGAWVDARYKYDCRVMVHYMEEYLQ